MSSLLRKTLTALLLTAGLGLTAAANDLMQKAMDLMAQQKFAEAAVAWDQMLQATPAYGYGQYQLGVCRYNLKDYVGAEISFNNALLLFERDRQFEYLPLARIMLSNTLMEKDPCLGMPEPCTQSTARRKVLEAVLANLGGSLDSAPPEYRESYFAIMMRAADELGDPGLALASLEKWLVADPANGAAQKMFVYAFSKADQEAKGLDIARRISAKQPSAGIRKVMAQLLIGMAGGADAGDARLREASAILEGLVREDPANTDLLRISAQLYQASGRHQDAINAWRRAGDPVKDPSIAMALSRCYRALEQYTPAITVLTEALAALKPGDPAAKGLHLQLARTHEASGIQRLSSEEIATARGAYLAAGMPAEAERMKQVNAQIAEYKAKGAEARDKWLADKRKQDAAAAAEAAKKKKAYDCYMYGTNCD